MKDPDLLLAEQLERAILALEPGDDVSFRILADRVNAFQVPRNPVLRAFGNAAPFLPIAAFREASVATFPVEDADAVFRSSGTSGSVRSAHYVKRIDWHHRVSLEGFLRLVGRHNWRVIGCLPEYAPDSSLVSMVAHLASHFVDGGLIGTNHFKLERQVNLAARDGQRLLLIGAAFGLLDLVEKAHVELPSDALVIETGGMKTHRQAITRRELHDRLREGFGEARIGSEFGMCELTSQGWAPEGGLYLTPPWMRCRIVDPQYPHSDLPKGQSGALVIEDLGNLYTAASILTEDRAVIRKGGLDVLGRLSGRELRGCNFLMEELND